MFKKITLILMVALLPLFVAAQTVKLGYINSQEVMMMMPEVNDVEKQLAEFNEKNMKYLQDMEKEIQDKYVKYEQEKDNMTEAKDTKGAEFLSGFTKEDKLKPVITLVVYWGTKKWNAPRSLKEMFEDVSEDVLQFVSDYKVNLIVPKEIKDFTKFKTELGKALKYISVVDQKEEYKELTKQEEYQDVNKETAILLKEVAGINVKVKKEEEKVNMCKALQDITDEAIEKGHIKGRAEETVRLCREFGQSEEAILNRLMKELNLTEEQALQYMK